MSAIRHDRSVIEARGGIWTEIADAIRADIEAEVRGRPLRPFSGAIVPAHVQLRRRRRLLGLTQMEFAKLAGIGKAQASTVESGRGNARGMKLYMATLVKAEAERNTADNPK